MMVRNTVCGIHQKQIKQKIGTLGPVLFWDKNQGIPIERFLKFQSIFIRQAKSSEPTTSKCPHGDFKWSLWDQDSQNWIENVMNVGCDLSKPKQLFLRNIINAMIDRML